MTDDTSAQLPPLEQRLEHYLKICTDALEKIIPLCQVDVREYVQSLPHSDFFNQQNKNRGDVFCIAESALMQVPRTKEGYKVT